MLENDDVRVPLRRITVYEKQQEQYRYVDSIVSLKGVIFQLFQRKMFRKIVPVNWNGTKRKGIEFVQGFCKLIERLVFLF